MEDAKREKMLYSVVSVVFEKEHTYSTGAKKKNITTVELRDQKDNLKTIFVTPAQFAKNIERPGSVPDFANLVGEVVLLQTRIQIAGETADHFKDKDGKQVERIHEVDNMQPEVFGRKASPLEASVYNRAYNKFIDKEISLEFVKREVKERVSAFMSLTEKETEFIENNPIFASALAR